MGYCKALACLMLPAAIVAGSPSIAHAAEEIRTTEAPRANLFVETDPAMFALGGFAAHVRFRLPAAPNWSFGAGAYALTLPSFMVDLDSADRGQGWTSRITFAAGAFVDRFFRDDGEGLFVGAQLSGQRFRLTRSDTSGQTAFTNLLVMPRVGYFWRPFQAGFYVMPWLGVGGTARVEGDVVLGGRRYDVFPVVAFATVHVGWRF
jgi:hypothetical protein